MGRSLGSMLRSRTSLLISLHSARPAGPSLSLSLAMCEAGSCRVPPNGCAAHRHAERARCSGLGSAPPSCGGNEAARLRGMSVLDDFGFEAVSKAVLLYFQIVPGLNRMNGRKLLG